MVSIWLLRGERPENLSSNPDAIMQTKPVWEKAIRKRGEDAAYATIMRPNASPSRDLKVAIACQTLHSQPTTPSQIITPKHHRLGRARLGRPR